MGVGVGIMGNIVWMVGGRMGLERKKGKGSGLRVEICMEEGEEEVGYRRNRGVYDKNKLDDVVGIENDEVLVVMVKEMYWEEGIEWESWRDGGGVMEMIGEKE